MNETEWLGFESDLTDKRIEEENAEYVCPECEGELHDKQVLYGEDADGNRGTWITIKACGSCRYVEDY